LNQVDRRAQHLRLVAKVFDPGHLRLAAKPGQLAFGIVAMALLGSLDCSLNAQCARQHGHCLPVAEGVQSLHRPVAGKQGARLLDQACRKHGGATAVEAVIERLPRRIESDAQQREAGQRIPG
jgi:hypothetical protein